MGFGEFFVVYSMMRRRPSGAHILSMNHIDDVCTRNEVYILLDLQELKAERDA